MKKISIIIPVYNASKYLRNCLKSVVEQSYLNLEIILINDGSTDNSLSICEEYKKKDNRIVLIDQVNEGVSSARNKALNTATGDYIGFIDSDDFVSPDMFKTLISHAELYDADIVECGFKTIKNGTIAEVTKLKSDTLLTSDEILEKVLARDNTINAIWNKVYKKELFDDLFFPPFKYSEDYYINVITALKSKKKITLDNVCYYYVLNDDGAMSKPFNKDKLDNILAREAILNNLRNIKSDSHSINLVKLDLLSTIIILYIDLINTNYLKKDETILFLKETFERIIDNLPTKYILKYRKKMMMVLIIVLKYSPLLFEKIVKMLYVNKER